MIGYSMNKIVQFGWCPEPLARSEHITHRNTTPNMLHVACYFPVPYAWHILGISKTVAHLDDSELSE